MLDEKFEIELFMSDINYTDIWNAKVPMEMICMQIQ